MDFYFKSFKIFEHAVLPYLKKFCMKICYNDYIGYELNFFKNTEYRKNTEINWTGTSGSKIIIKKRWKVQCHNDWSIWLKQRLSQSVIEWMRNSVSDIMDVQVWQEVLEKIIKNPTLFIINCLKWRSQKSPRFLVRNSPRIMIFV